MQKQHGLQMEIPFRVPQPPLQFENIKTTGTEMILDELSVMLLL